MRADDAGDAVSKQDMAPAPHKVPFSPTDAYPEGLIVGLDVGSTTVKAVVVDSARNTIVWKQYRRHETRQAETCLAFLEQIAGAFPDAPLSSFRIFATGSGGRTIARQIGARFVQEVNAVSLAVERLFPDVHSVVELGGQDAKIIILKNHPDGKRKKKFLSMNDKCAGGTGAVIDKIAAKLGLSMDGACQMRYAGIKTYPVAGKCGVFAESDINGLQKQGVPSEELIASLLEAIVQQNLSVLTRGHTLFPRVLLLGGPNYFCKGLLECWRESIPVTWRERNVPLPEKASIEDLIFVPENAQYFAAIGAVEYARIELEDEAGLGVYQGPERLKWYITTGREQERDASACRPLVTDKAELDAFQEQFTPEPWSPARFEPGTCVEAYVGIDGGSTSTKAVLLGLNGEVLAKAYQLSRGNPIEDTKTVLKALQEEIETQGARLEVRGAATTGYAKDILKDVFGADVALVETVAHTQSGLRYYPGADVICDVGGQDIKIIILKNGVVKDFRLNTQCSAGNGYYLQATAESFGIPVERYAETAFTARAMPEFGYGCAVFMQSDIVNFQRQGWQPNEIMAGLAAVLPKNIWFYVCQIPNLAQLGRTFILQGGTQRNLAAVKAQVDFIHSRFKGTDIEPRIVVHRHCGESGAIGCALEVRRVLTASGGKTSFIGLDAAQGITYRTTRNEATRCHFCKNRCMRTFIDVKIPGYQAEESAPAASAKKQKADKLKSGVPLEPGERRIIIATCEKGACDGVDAMREVMKNIEEAKRRNPNMAEVAARLAFKPVLVENVADPLPSSRWPGIPAKRAALRHRRALMEARESIRIGIPRVLNMYSLGPFFMGFFQSLGISAGQIVWSDYTTDTLYREGAKRGSIDPCFPSKLAIPHVHNLLYKKHTATKPLSHIFMPMVDSIPSYLEYTEASRACPTSVATPEATYAAFVTEGDIFAEKGIAFKRTFLDLAHPRLCARQLHEGWYNEIGVSEEEAWRAVQQGLVALEAYRGELRRQGREILDMLDDEERPGLVLLARPYHNDPGVNHEIPEEFQQRGYPILTIDSLPLDDDMLDRLFGEEVALGAFRSPLSIEDVWKKSYSENSSRKIWAAKYVARHPWLMALELSSFKCGHDAPIYSVIEGIVEQSRTPYFYFKDIDENKPAGAIKIRVETITYFLKQYQARHRWERSKRSEIEQYLARLEAGLRAAV